MHVNDYLLDFWHISIRLHVPNQQHVTPLQFRHSKAQVSRTDWRKHEIWQLMQVKLNFFDQIVPSDCSVPLSHIQGGNVWWREDSSLLMFIIIAAQVANESSLQESFWQLFGIREWSKHFIQLHHVIIPYCKSPLHSQSSHGIIYLCSLYHLACILVIRPGMFLVGDAFLLPVRLMKDWNKIVEESCFLHFQQQQQHFALTR